MFRLLKVIKEIKLYREYRKIIRKEELNSPRWAKAKLRRDWVYRIYTVINLSSIGKRILKGIQKNIYIILIYILFGMRNRCL